MNECVCRQSRDQGSSGCVYVRERMQKQTRAGMGGANFDNHALLEVKVTAFQDDLLTPQVVVFM